jgi:thiol-disulfide isomerase/thioredoxin
MFNTRSLLFVLFMGVSTLSNAVDLQPYSAQALEAAEKAAKPVAILFHADWCPTCKAQQKSLEALKAEKSLAITVLSANYDTERDLKRRFKVNSQSTMIVPKGSRETTRLVGESSPQGLKKALMTAL